VTDTDTAVGASRRVDYALLGLLLLFGVGTALTGRWMGSHVVSVCGLLLAIVSLWSLVRADPRMPQVWRAAIVILLAVGFVLRLVAFSTRVLDLDEWALMSGVGGNLASYTHGSINSFSIILTYWVSHRLFGDDLLCYRIFSCLVGMSILPLMAFGLRRFWPKAVSLTVLCFVCFNSYSIWVCRYAPVPYSISLLVCCLLFLLFLRLAEGPIQGKAWIYVLAGIPLAAFFSGSRVVVAVGVGVLTVVAFRLRRVAIPLRLRCFMRLVWQLSPIVLVFVAIPLMEYARLHSPVFGRAAGVFYVRPLLFPTSGFAHNALGGAGYVVSRTYALLAGVVGTHLPLTEAMLGLVGLCLLLAIGQSVRRRVDPRIAFTWVFTLGCMVLIAVGGLLGFYPYGNVRYAPFLILPLGVILGHGSSLVFHWLNRKWPWRRSWRALVLFAVLSPAVVGGFLARAMYIDATHKNLANHQAIAWMLDQNPELVLYDDHISPVLRQLTPGIWRRGVQMGWGGQWEGDSVPSNIANLINGSGPAPVPARVMVVVRWGPPERTFPALAGLLRRHYVTLDSLEPTGSDIGVRLYERRSAD